MPLPKLDDWWKSGKGYNAYTRFTTPTGKADVYLRRHIADPKVMMIANISLVSGYGVSRPLYRTYTRDIPAIAENILNSQLDALLERWGWDFAYRDQLGTPTRINKAFQKAYPNFAEAQSPSQAIVQANFK